MRIKEKHLRKMIQEEILNETPLVDISNFNVPPQDEVEKLKYASIGYPRTRSRRPQYRAGGYEKIAKELMRDTEDDWAIVTLSSIVPDTRALVDSPAFRSWIADRNYSPGTRVLVSASTPVDRDFRSPAWQIIHDIFGHTLEWFWSTRFSDYVSSLSNELQGALHDALPSEFRISKNRRDVIPDIFGAILTRRFSISEAQSAVERISTETNKMRHHDAVRSMFDAVDTWLARQRIQNDVIIMTPF